MRRAEIGHHHIAGTYLARYAQEAGWREDRRREPNGSQVRRVVGLRSRRRRPWTSAALAAGGAVITRHGLSTVRKRTAIAFV